MAVGVCGVVFALAVLGVAAARDRLGVGQSLREALVAAAALVGGFIAAITESLGASGQLRFAPIFISWLAAALFLGIFVFRHRHNLSGWWKASEPFTWTQRLLLAAIAVIVAASGTVAVLCPPSNYDVALYHLPRQLQWLQQASVAHFPTQDYRLTVNPPFAEFVGLHLMALSGTDRLATVESWFAMLLTLAAVSLVGRELGLSRTGQLLAALFAATVPVGFHEAANGKNDWWVAFWLIASTYWVLRVGKAERIRLMEAVYAGLSLGLLLFTKGTGGIFAIPLVLMGGIALALRRPSGWLRALLITACLTLVPSLGHWSRNFNAYGSVSGKTFG
ncbi:MAG TPA: glycosyltransferase family 39 protein, partial [Gemmataceae bacterium]